MSAKPTLEGAKRRSPWTLRRIILGVVLAYVLLLVLVNRNTVAVNFVFFKTEASLFVVLLLAIGLGFLGGWLFDDVRDRRRRNRMTS
ncbi:MAG: LapA family protein [Thermoleophilia bacterium]